MTIVNYTSLTAPTGFAPAPHENRSSSSSSQSQCRTYVSPTAETRRIVLSNVSLRAMICSYIPYDIQLSRVSRSFRMTLEPSRIVVLQSRMEKQKVDMRKLLNVIGDAERNISTNGTRRLLMVQEEFKNGDHAMDTYQKSNDYMSKKTELTNLYQKHQEYQQTFDGLHKLVHAARLRQERQSQRAAAKRNSWQDPHGFAPFTLASTVFAANIQDSQ